MKRTESSQSNRSKPQLVVLLLTFVTLVGLFGCRSTPAQKANSNFFTSGSREADQRASQRMAQTEQLTGTGEGSGEKGVKKAQVTNPEQPGTSGGETNQGANLRFLD